MYILHIFPFEKLRCILNSRNMHLSKFFLKPTFINWKCLKFKGILYSKYCGIYLTSDWF